MSDLSEFGRMLMACVAVGALGAAGVRIASRLSIRSDVRVVAAASLAAFTAIAEALLLGLAGVGENGAALLVTSLAIGAVVIWRVTPATGPSLSAQLSSGYRALAALDVGVLVAAVVGGATALTYWLRRPFTPYDALMYHLTEPAIWLHNGHPGSLHVVNEQIPVQAYPKNTEVLLGWLLGLTHSAVVGAVLMFGFFALGAIALIAALSFLGIGRRHGALAAAAVLSVPVIFLQLAGPSTDLPSMVWVVVTAALCLAAVQEFAVMPVAFIAAGLALGTKATTAPIVIVMLAATLWVRRAEVRSTVVSLAAGLGLGAALGGLWYVQNWIVYGAPLYPFYRFPSGPTLPITITAFGTSFIHSPRSSLRVGTARGYVHWFGGGPLFIAAIVLAALVLLRSRGSERRWLGASIVAAVVVLLIWANGPFTGYPGLPDTTFFPLDGVRYLVPGLPVVALPLVLLTKRAGFARHLAELILVAVIAINVFGVRWWRPPYRPPMVVLLAGLVVGAALGGLVAVLRRGEVRRPGLLRAPVAAVAAVVVAAGLLTVPATGYLARAAAVTQPGETFPFSVNAVIGWLETQPAWVHGHQPIGAGPIIDAFEAGPTFNHLTFLVSQATSCARVRQLHANDWLIFVDPLVVNVKDFTYLTFNRSSCMTGIKPGFSGSGFLIYRPADD